MESYNPLSCCLAYSLAALHLPLLVHQHSLQCAVLGQQICKELPVATTNVNNGIIPAGTAGSTSSRFSRLVTRHTRTHSL
jgi:hypothetical protein